MVKYPDIFPAEAAQALISGAFNFKDADVKTVVAAAYEVTGFILGQTVGQPTQKYGAAPQAEFNGLIGARDPKKEKQVQQQVLGFLSLAYGMALFNRDVGIPAVLLAVNSLILANWPDLAETYWSAKGM